MTFYLMVALCALAGFQTFMWTREPGAGYVVFTVLLALDSIINRRSNQR